ncbi:MAG TPA: secretin N-terminal domain-containing protein, partial [Gammaproteobacteria bacterium]|nr:secretin N-terminal domain-containing protein [Gammaproteobacteria bacterium]
MKTSMPLRLALAVLWAGAAAWPAAAQQADPRRPQNAQGPTGPIELNFVDAELQNVVEALGAQIGKNFLLPPGQNLGTKVTIFSHHPVPPDLAYEVLESLLAANSFSLVDTLDGNLVKIVPIGKNQEKLDIEKGTTQPRIGFDNYLIRIVNVEFAAADEVATLLKSVASEVNDIQVWNSTNTLIIRDTSEGMRNMLVLLEAIDVPGNQAVMDIFTLQYERAETIQQYLQDVLSDDSSSGPASGARSAVQTRAQTQRVRQIAVPGGRTAPTQVGSREDVLRMVPNERLNALIVVASEPLMVQVRDLIDQIDTPTPYEENTIQYVELRNADAEEVAEVLESLAGLAPRQGGEGPAGGGAQGAQVQPFEKEISITSYEATNSLIVVATPQDFRRLELLIGYIDVPIRQVNVEAIIMEVTISDRFELGVELLGLTGNDAFGLNNVASLTNAILGGPLALAGPGTTFGILDGTTQIPVPGIVGEGALSGGTGLQTIPNVPVLLKALETVTDVEVLSQPNLLTRDNQESKITVGQDIPILSSLM